MNSGGNTPSIDPADEDSLTGAFRFILNKMLQDVNGMLPARVISYDREANRAQVQPLIAILTTDNSQISRAPIASVPVMQLGGGNFFINFKLTPGSLGWISANDRDISLFLQSYNESKPNTNRKNNFSDSVFIPDIMTNYTIVEDDELMTIQNRNGTVRMGFLEDKVRIVAPLGLEVIGPISANGGISVTGGTGFSVTGNFNMTGQMHVSGDISASGSITPGVPP